MISTITTEDLVAVREAIARCAIYVDRRDIPAAIALFAPAGGMTIHPRSLERTPLVAATGPAELVNVFDGLDQFTSTTHFLGQTVLEIDGESIRAETNCLAHHLHETDIEIVAVRYQDHFVRYGDEWLIQQRTIVIDWSDKRALVRTVA